MAVRVPAIKSLEIALSVYYQNGEIGNKDIKELFGNISHGKIVALKDLAKKVQAEKEIGVFNPMKVNTDCAYTAWGLNPEDLENRLKKLQKLQLI